MQKKNKIWLKTFAIAVLMKFGMFFIGQVFTYKSFLPLQKYILLALSSAAAALKKDDYVCVRDCLQNY